MATSFWQAGPLAIRPWMHSSVADALSIRPQDEWSVTRKVFATARKWGHIGSEYADSRKPSSLFVQFSQHASSMFISSAVVSWNATPMPTPCCTYMTFPRVVNLP